MSTFFKRGLLTLAVLSLATQVSAVQTDDANQWTRFRGNNGSGIVAETKAATSWNGEENIKWQIELPGPGSSSPIVHGDKVFVTCYTGYGTDRRSPGEMKALQRLLLCYDRTTGKELWRATAESAVDEDPYQGFIAEHGYASSTPVTDGEHVFAFFGKTGVLAFDMNGNKKWQTSVGTKSDPAKWGGGASPILHDDVVIVNAGIEGHALVALKKSDGSEAWKIEDSNFTNNWMTPILVEVDGHTELIYTAPEKIYGINPNSGEQLWHATMPIKRTITASVVAHDGVVYTLGGRQGRAFAIRCGGKGDVTESHMVWEQPVSSSVGTPVIFNDHMYWLAGGGGGIAMCLSTKDGSEVKKARLESAGGGGRGPAGNYASPIVAGDKMLITTRSGTTHVFSASPELEVKNKNSFEGDDSLFNGTPAVTPDAMYIRSDKMLYCIGPASK